jgi:hypothetical protein
MTIKRILNVSGNSPVEINRQLSHIMDVLNEMDNAVSENSQLKGQTFYTYEWEKEYSKRRKER